jgi:hypothetical protein
MSQDEYNTDLATRQAEINEWSYNNKLDTLFVFQLIFLGLTFLAILMYLKTRGILGGPFVMYVSAILIIIITVIIANRAMYTANRRDSRFWNRRRFISDNNKDAPPMGNIGMWRSYLDALERENRNMGARGVAGSAATCPTGCSPATTASG